jgi:signal transduction histidine kinase
MQPHHVTSPSSHNGIQFLSLNGSGFGEHRSGIDSVPVNGDSALFSELQLLTRKVEQLSAANRRKDEFLLVLSHELRSPLASIQNGMGVLRGQKDAKETVQRRTHELIDRQVRQIAQIASDLLDIGRITSAHFLMRLERTDLHAVVAKAIETVEPEFARRRQVLEPTWAAPGVGLMGDASRLEQVFVNLLVNASKYTDPGGQVKLSISVEGRDAVVRIKDSGIGISAQALPHIFDLYMQADSEAVRSRSGLGIGLALVRNIVKLHGGAVSATSGGLGQGSEFEVHLPIEASESEAELDGALLVGTT